MESNNSKIPILDPSGNESCVYKRSIARTVGAYVSSMAGERCISCTTFNILAPIYKRLDQQVFYLFLSYLKTVLFIVFAHKFLFANHVFSSFFGLVMIQMK